MFVDGRKDVFSEIKHTISKDDRVLWMHAASLGEFEQGLPVLEKIEIAYSDYKILITFFSPSGYEIKKDTPVADLVTYLPLDTKKNAQEFIRLAKPKLAIFVKYEIWPNYLHALQHQHIPVLLISARFKKNQIYFKSYGFLMRKALKHITHFFVQDDNSKVLLESIGLKNSTVSGDTRFDRVSEILKRDNSLLFMDRFKQNYMCFVAGSTWPEDEEILINYINASSQHLKYVIAPHNIKLEHINKLKSSITKKTLLYSEIEDKELHDFEVLIIDIIGLLTKIYSYADIAYVGGGFATGLHNTLEPAVFGIPVLIGPNYSGFKEAEELVEKKGILVIYDTKDFETTLNDLIEDKNYLRKIGGINTSYVSANKGASIQIEDHIRTLL